MNMRVLSFEKITQLIDWIFKCSRKHHLHLSTGKETIRKGKERGRKISHFFWLPAGGWKCFGFYQRELATQSTSPFVALLDSCRPRLIQRHLKNNPWLICGLHEQEGHRNNYLATCFFEMKRAGGGQKIPLSSLSLSLSPSPTSPHEISMHHDWVWLPFFFPPLNFDSMSYFSLLFHRW